MKSAPSARELADVYTPNFVELVWAEKRTRESAPRVGLLALLKTFQRLGYFVSLPEVPRPILEHGVAATSNRKPPLRILIWSHSVGSQARRLASCQIGKHKFRYGWRITSGSPTTRTLTYPVSKILIHCVVPAPDRWKRLCMRVSTRRSDPPSRSGPPHRPVSLDYQSLRRKEIPSGWGS
jgi:Domain of unknown function (DUF4158)